MGVGAEGQHQRPRRARLAAHDVAAHLLHPGGVPRAAPQRRPEHGRDRDHRRHRDPARRPDPGLPDDPGARATTSATSSSSEVSLYDDATQAEIAALEERSARSRTSPTSTSSPRPQALEILAEAGTRTPRTILDELNRNPLPASFDVNARRRRQPRRGSQRDRRRPAPNGKPQPISPIIEKRLRLAQDEAQQDRAGDRAR